MIKRNPHPESPATVPASIARINVCQRVSPTSIEELSPSGKILKMSTIIVVIKIIITVRMANHKINAPGPRLMVLSNRYLNF